jgi:hypothetical protein
MQATKTNVILYRFLIPFLLVFITSHSFSQQPFTPGNIVVYRQGDGTADLTTMSGLMAPVFLDEYTPTGTLVQSIAMPVSGKKLTAVVDYGAYGSMSLSADGRYLVVPGYDLEPGNADYIGDKSIAMVNFNGTISSMTVVANPNFDIFFSATSDNGNNLWLGGEGGGIQFTHAGDVSATTINSSDNRQVGITNGQLYASLENSPYGIAAIGTGLPTTAGQTAARLPGFPIKPSMNQFAFADMDPGVPGVDVLYVADQSSSGGGLEKYSLVGGTWVSNGTIGTEADGYVGLTIKVSANTVTIFATRNGSNTSNNTGGGDLVSLTDNSGYNGTLSGTPVVISSVLNRFGANDLAAFRSVARVPLNCPEVDRLQVIDITATQATLKWNSVTGGSNFEYYVDTNPLPGGNAVEVTSNTSVTVKTLLNNVTYYAHVRTVCSPTTRSEWNTVEFKTECKAPTQSTLIVKTSTTGSTTISWRSVLGAQGYQYVVSKDSTPPISGTATIDTSVVVTNLDPVTKYYIHVRSICETGVQSGWITKDFSTNCFMPVINVSLMAKAAGVKWNKVRNAVKYEYALTYTAARPLSGSYTTDTFYTMDKLSSGSPYFFHIRTICAGGVISEWSTLNFHMEGMETFPNPVTGTLRIQLNGVNISNKQIDIYDMNGRLIKKIQLVGNSVEVNTTNWSQGIYIVFYADDQRKYTRMVIKK